MHGNLVMRLAFWGLTALISVASATEARRDPAEPDEPAADESDGGGLGAFPILGYTPETSGMFGGLVVYHFDSPDAGVAAREGTEPKRSSVQVASFYTLKQQYLVALAPTVYVGHDWRISGEVALSHFPDTYYPEGPDTPESAAEDYTQRSVLAALNVERRLFSHLSTGIHVLGIARRVLEVDPDGELSSGNVLGSAGGELYAAGPSLIWDSRERDYAARYGARHQVAWLVAPPVFNADYGYSEVRIDLRQYLSTVAGQVLALQVYAHTTWHRVPFQGLAAIGGDGRMRGYFARRYQDRASLNGQAEYRVPLFWRIGAVGFIGAGSVAPSVDSFQTEHLRYVAGAGLRGALNQKDGVNLRVDFGVTGEGTKNFYVQVGEAF